MESTAQNSGEQPKPVGRPWPKGVSGNPGGRPKSASRQVRALLSPHVKHFIQQLMDLSENGDGEVRLEAIKLALAYVSGPPADQPLPEDVPAESEMTAEQAEAALTGQAA